ncbi:MAG: tetratricopeptide repeat protein [Pirellulaceae bacterium]|nr:tetratricopeptide repeat protein [Pirellulaceae bacterium]
MALPLVIGTVGCVSLSRGGVDERVVEARQLTLRGIEAMESNQWSEAGLLLSKAIESCPYEERAHARYAEVLWKLEKPEPAIREMTTAVRLSGGAAPRLSRLGEMHLAAGNVTAAIDAANRAIQSDPQLPQAHALQGDLEARNNRFNEALASYHRALSLQPHFPSVQLAAAKIYRLQRRPLRALATLSALREQYSIDGVPMEVLHLQGVAQLELGRHSDAAQTLSLCANRGGASAELLYQLADARRQAGDIVGARHAISQALTVSPGHAPSLALHAKLVR